MPQIIIELVNGGFVVTADSPDQRIDHGHGMFEQRPQPPQRYVGRNMADLQEIVVPAVLNLTRPMEPTIASAEADAEQAPTPAEERKACLARSLAQDRPEPASPEPEPTKLEVAAHVLRMVRMNRNALAEARTNADAFLNRTEDDWFAVVAEEEKATSELLRIARNEAPPVNEAAGVDRRRVRVPYPQPGRRSEDSVLGSGCATLERTNQVKDSYRY